MCVKKFPLPIVNINMVNCSLLCDPKSGKGPPKNLNLILNQQVLWQPHKLSHHVDLRGTIMTLLDGINPEKCQWGKF